MKVKSIGQIPENEPKPESSVRSPFSYLDKTQKKVLLIALGLATIVSVLFIFLSKSEYEKGVEALSKKNYKEAHSHFSNVKKDYKNYDIALKSARYSAGMFAYEGERWADALIFLSSNLNAEQRNTADSIRNLSIKEYYRTNSIDGLDFSVNSNSLKYSGLFTTGGELVFQISNESTKPLILNSDDFNLLIESDNKFYRSKPNPTKTIFLDVSSMAGKDNSAYSFAIKPSAKLKVILNFDNVKEREADFPKDIATVKKYSNKDYLIDFPNKEFVINFQKDAWLIYPIDKIALREPSNTSSIINSKVIQSDVNSMSASDIVKIWINAIGSQNLRTAYDLMTKEKAGDFDTFCSSNFYGGVIKTNIFSINTEKGPKANAEEKEYDEGAIVIVDYESFDAHNKNGRFKQRFFLTIFEENGEYESSWKIYDIKNIEVNYYD